jgi:hypothetical protein
MSTRKAPKPKLPYHDAQREFVERSRRETMAEIGNRSIPLGLGPQIVRPDFGPNCSTYFAAKFKRGEVGTYWLHQVLHFNRGQDQSL